MGGTTEPPTGPIMARYVRFIARSELTNQIFTSMSEINILNENGQPLSRAGWSIQVDSQETVNENAPATNAVDGNASTFWHSHWLPGNNMGDPLPHCFQIDLGQAQPITGFTYQGRPNGNNNGRVGNYEFYLSNNPDAFGMPRITGTFMSVATPQQADLP